MGNCWQCKYFTTAISAKERHLRLLGEGDDEISFGICHRFPMSVQVLGESDWCGEYDGLPIGRSESNYSAEWR